MRKKLTVGFWPNSAVQGGNGRNPSRHSLDDPKQTLAFAKKGQMYLSDMHSQAGN